LNQEKHEESTKRKIIGSKKKKEEERIEIKARAPRGEQWDQNTKIKPRETRREHQD
jgi:hypothetical protein